MITDLVPNSISTKPLYQSQSPDSNCSVSGIRFPTPHRCLEFYLKRKPRLNLYMAGHIIFQTLQSF